MRELKHPHKFLIFSGIFQSIKNSIVPLIIFFASVGPKILKDHGGNYTLALIVVAFLAVDIIFAIVKWKKSVYSIEDEGIYIKYGVFELHERTIPFSQVQSADTSSSLVQRLFNVYKLEIDTAGGDKKSEVSILLSKEEALRIKNIIFKVSKNEDNYIIAEEKSVKKFTSSLKDLFMMATMSSRILAGISIIIAFYFKIDDIIPKEFKRKAEVYGKDMVNGIKGTSIVKYIIAIFFILFFISWIISIIITIIKYYNFTVIREEDNIKLSYGLFDKKEVTIPVKRIQSLIIVEGVIKKPLGYFSLNVETIGYGKDKGESTMICPIAKKKVINKFFEDILPEMNVTYDLISSPRKALKGFLLFRLLDDLIILSLIAIFVPYGYYVFFLVPIILRWHYIRFKDNALYHGKDFVVVRSRRLARKTVIIHKECIQSIEKIQNVFQKRKAIAKCKVTIAGDSLGKSYTVGYMNGNYIDNILEIGVTKSEKYKNI